VSGAGCLIRNSMGKLVSVASYKLKEGTYNSTELQALSKGLSLAASLKIENLEIEGDSLVIINAIIKKRALSWKLDLGVQKNLWQLSFFNNWSIRHVYREGNQCADWLANKGIEKILWEKVDINGSAWEGLVMMVSKEEPNYGIDGSSPRM
ncbi:hypothetical protein KI387_017393, partial [Taxus chinensis]